MFSFKNLLLAAVAATATQAYSNNCDGSFFSPTLGDCKTGLANINVYTQYSDHSQFSYGNCYIIYATNGAGAQPVSGQVILDTANNILNQCSSHHGSYGTNNNCASCHVTVNYRSWIRRLGGAYVKMAFTRWKLDRSQITTSGLASHPPLQSSSGNTVGLVLANRPSEDSTVRVLVLEADKDRRSDSRITTPLLYQALMGADVDWDVVTEPQAAPNDKTIGLPLGRVLEGSSAINGQVFLAISKEVIYFRSAAPRAVKLDLGYLRYLLDLEVHARRMNPESMNEYAETALGS
ncbi:hypothetical protein EKO27_g7228 [Xylaria grammica]|uniref:Uncharacterized protein n=1 Tax=Xylaria grammica TaxID=363999 RepID=A0A439D0H7_9PEZI|nr:hypothetical protein EKO27_g7228 [Xylaria grammica]